MLRGISTLKGLTVGALDGEVGSVYDVYFDDKQWTVRYFVVDTGTWLSGRRVLISPMALRQPADVVGDRLQVGLSKAQIENAPSWDTDKPVSRQHEIAYARHMAMYLLKEDAGQSVAEICRAFGNRDHSTVLSGIQRIVMELGTRPETAADVTAVRAALTAAPVAAAG